MLVAISAFMLLVTLLLDVPMFTKYGALAWYGWVLILSTLASFVLTIIISLIIKYLREVTDQGLGGLLIEILEEKEEDS